MKRLKLQRPLLSFVAATFLACTSDAMAGSCKAIDSTTETLNFGASLANGSLTIPADTPDGTVVYQDTVQGAGHSWTCTLASQYGVLLNPKRGSVTGRVTTFPLGKTGLSFRIWIEWLDRYEASLQTISANSAYGFSAGSVRLEIVKTGKLASQVRIDAGALGSLQDDDLILKKFNLTNPIVLNAASCQTPSVPVAMGDDYHLLDFRETGATPRTVRFNIGLNQCQTGIKKVTYSLKANTPVIDSANGIVALNDSSTAKGIGLQLMNDAGQPMALDTTYPFDAFTTTGTDFKIPLSASYYRLATDELKAGSANTDVTFIVNYL
ncbi:P pilus assembly protein, pilin FimA [Pseudomonas sp. GM49]|uniref:fimbrial protein n=1 Tax=Pseudomonas sp. GM49 TaxID=1144331 RepID=UPI00026FED83|nr:fimbrial protein [Pseudomonas sp. GM49]EJM56734.1 P pilus assembly protein, pilin FimA [Pseudomonas sp. GM49]